ncbi:quinon protein alcohol dehydrogenase-like superfamily [Suillus subaureus]|uniref:Quinon protein alcohol dehydrogenase-like superfamily n=1 Tax=Suillus subaureus TaxID=48587 RepID=A0A9P7DSK3_9AGAM|nr:quinon protein alcohol dehydrogenase-like superfamily [Suillus subaureus]KAG1801981.1 quinon protein alcohol dehydrogenase-like superfamily [Suillus subaureus]
MVTGSYDGMLRLWDLKTGLVLKKMEGHRSRVRALAVSPNGCWIASGDESGELIAWNGQTGELLNQAIKAHDGWIFSLDFSRDRYNCSTLASGSSDTTMKLWSTSTWRVGEPWKGHFKNIHAISLNSSGTLLASASHDNRVRLWRLSDRRNIAILKHSGEVNCVTFSLDDKHILSGAVSTRREGVSVGDRRSGEKMEGHHSRVRALAVSPNGNWIASGDESGELIAWNGQTGELLNQAIKAHDGWIFSLDFSRDSRALASGSSDTTTKLWDWDTSTWLQVGEPWKGHFKNIHAISLNSSSTLLASASHDNCVRLWRLSDGRNIAIFKHSGEVNCVTFSADGKHVLSGGVDKKISEWPISEDALPENDPKDGLMTEQATHQVSSFSFSCPFII